MKYFSLILVLAVVVAVSAYPSWEKRRGPGGGGSGGDGGKPGGQSGGPGPGSGGQQQQGQQKQGQQQKGQQEQGQQEQGGEGEQKQEGEGEKEVFGPFVTDECKAFLTELHEFRKSQKEAQEPADEDDGEETRALHLIRELELVLLRRQEEPDPSACEASFGQRLQDVADACDADSEAEGCDQLEELLSATAAVNEIVDGLSGGTEVAPPPETICWHIVSYPFREHKEGEEEVEEPLRRKRDAYADMWGAYADVNAMIKACWDFYWGGKGHGKEGEGEGQRQGEGEKQGDGQGPPPGGDGGEGGDGGDGGPPPGGQDGGARRGIYSARRGRR